MQLLHFIRIRSQTFIVQVVSSAFQMCTEIDNCVFSNVYTLQKLEMFYFFDNRNS